MIRRPLTMLLALGLLGAAGCGDDDTTAPPTHDLHAGPADMTVTARPDLAGGGGGGDDGDDSDDGGAESPPHAIIVPISPTGHDRFFGVAYDSAGSVYAVGQVGDSTVAGADISTVVAKFDASGKLDPSFGSGGKFIINVAAGASGELFRSIIVQSTGKVVISGAVEQKGATEPRERDIAIVRLTANGVLDESFGDADDKGVVIVDLGAGVANGSSWLTDSTWGLAKYPGSDDRFVLHVGHRRPDKTETDFGILRYLADGTPDLAFNAGGTTPGQVFVDTDVPGAAAGSGGNNASPRQLTILPGSDGIIGAGYQPNPGHDTAPVLYKIKDDGTPDSSFGNHMGYFSQSVLTDQTETYMAALQPIAGGGYNFVTTGYGKEAAGGSTDFVSLRVSASGALDTTYGTGGIAQLDIGGFGDNSRYLVVLPDNRVLLVGGGRATSADVDGVVALLTADGKPDTSFAAHGWKRIDLGGPADFLWSAALAPDHKTLAIVGVRGVGNAPTGGANDDAALVLLPAP